MKKEIKINSMGYPFSKDLKERLKNKSFKQKFEVEYANLMLLHKLADLRGELSLRQIDLARRMNVSQQMVSQLESGENGNVTIETILKAARAMGRDVTIAFPKSHGEFKFKVA